MTSACPRCGGAVGQAAGTSFDGCAACGRRFQRADAADVRVAGLVLPLSADLRGRYRLGELLGAGAFGAVLQARQVASGREVLVRIVAQPAGAPERARLEREARALAGIHHPGVVKVLDVSVSGGCAYLVTETLPGGSLRERIAAGALTTDEAVGIAIKVLRGTAALHAAGLGHRDLRAENVFLASDGEPRVGELGLSRIDARRAGGERTTPSEDQHAVGEMLAEMVTGELPARVAAALKTSLDAAPERRYPSVLAFAAALEEAL